MRRHAAVVMLAFLVVALAVISAAVAVVLVAVAVAVLVLILAVKAVQRVFQGVCFVCVVVVGEVECCEYRTRRASERRVVCWWRAGGRRSERRSVHLAAVACLKLWRDAA